MSLIKSGRLQAVLLAIFTLLVLAVAAGAPVEWGP
jgi:hypothetical protein